MGFIFADAKILIVFGGNNSFVEEKITPFLSKKTENGQLHTKIQGVNFWPNCPIC
jgi:hypothetical protein